MGRQPCCDKVGLKKGPWTAEEDKKLINFILTNGHCCWRAVPKLAGLLRCGKSCRLRWTNYLRPDLKRGLLSECEEKIVIDLHAKLGNRWSKIASHLPGRTDNEIKNHWNTHIKKKLKKMGIDPQTHKPIITQTQIDPQSHNQNQPQSSTTPNNNENNTKNIPETDHQELVETPGNSSITTNDHNDQQTNPIDESIIPNFEEVYSNIEAIDSFCVDDIPLMEPIEILPLPIQNNTHTTISSTSTSSSSSFSPSGSSSVFFEDLDIPIFDWPNYYEESANIMVNNNNNNNNETSTPSGLLWDGGELMNWDMEMNGDYFEIDPFHQIINQCTELNSNF